MQSAPKCNCGADVVLYWVHDGVWQKADHAALPPMKHLCPTCVGHIIGRPLQLTDLSIANYKNTAARNGMDFMKKYVRATVAGALHETGAFLPKSWTPPTDPQDVDAMQIGRQLAQQTPEAIRYLPALVSEVEREFPN